MISKKQIKESLLAIAENHNYSGESVEILTDLASYILFYNQTEIANVAQESSLVTAKLLNSKIKACMDVMYSVYRGRNASISLNFKSNTLINFKKFDQIYESNGFFIYAEEPIFRTSGSADEAKSVTGILCKSPKYEIELIISEKNKYYIDIAIDRTILSNLSEDIKVTIDDVEYQTTRNFYDHVNSSINLDDGLDKLFILTIPNYGIRIFKRGYRTETKGWVLADKVTRNNLNIDILPTATSIDKLPVGAGEGPYIIDGNIYVWTDTKLVEHGYFRPNTKVNIQCFRYTVLADINSYEVPDIIIPGTEMVPFYGYMEDEKTPVREGDDGRKLIEEIPRESAGSLLYNANLSTRTQSQILSNSDVNVLFSEFFIEKIIISNNWYDLKTNWLFIFYIPRPINGDILPLTISSIHKFIECHKSYFITNEILPVCAVLCIITVELRLYKNGSTDIMNEVKAIFDSYSNKLNSLETYETIGEVITESINNENGVGVEVRLGGSFVNEKIIRAEINRIPTVAYIDDMVFSGYNIKDGNIIISNLQRNIPIPVTVTKIFNKNTHEEIQRDLVDEYNKEDIYSVEIPIYYNFKIITDFIDNYEVIS
jgi:hypothetical protein